MSDYDLLILGSGPGGYTAALYAARQGLKTCLVEKSDIGGVCLNTGCIPTKTLLTSARLFSGVKGCEKFGIKINSASADFSSIMKRKEGIVILLRQGIESLLKARAVTVKRGFGKLLDKNTAIVGDEKIIARNIIIAAGSSTIELPFLKFDGENILSSDDLLNSSEIPKTLVIVGGGAIGCEFAFIYNAMGSRVVIIEMMENIIPLFDTEIAKRLEAALRRSGIEILTGTKASSVITGKNKGIVLKTEGEACKEIPCDKILVSIGRRPNTNGIGLREAGVIFTDKGIAVDNRMRTNIDNIYAIGDVTGKFMLAHTASYEAIVACDNILGRKNEADYTAVPSSIYTHPEVAATGINEFEARTRGINIGVARFHFRSLGRAHVSGDVEGMLKVVFEKETNRVIGFSIISDIASELIAEATLAVKMKCTLVDLEKTIHSHPTMSEALLEVSHAGLGRAIHGV